MIVCKAIKPRRFKSEAFNEQMTAAAREASLDIQKDFKRTTRSWSYQPYFDRLVQVGPNSIQVLVGTDDEIYNYVDKGTKPHKIPKAGPGFLAFPSGYTPKTKPNVLHSFPGGSFGDTVKIFKQVQHPGTKPRNFDKLIQKKWDKPFKRRMEEAMKQGAQKSGHGV